VVETEGRKAAEQEVENVNWPEREICIQCMSVLTEYWIITASTYSTCRAEGKKKHKGSLDKHIDRR
jgi:hypothetical protein